MTTDSWMQGINSILVHGVMTAKGLSLALLLFACFAGAPGLSVAAGSTGAARDLRIVDDAPPAVVFPGLHDAGGLVTIEVLADGVPVDGERMRVGMRNLQFRVSSRISGAVVLYDEKSDGTLYGLFPNRYSSDCAGPRTVTVGIPLTIPGQTCFEVVVEPPLGAHRLILLLLPEPVATALAERPFFAATRDLRPVLEPYEHLDQVRGTLARYCREQAGSDARCYLHIQPYEVAGD